MVRGDSRCVPGGLVQKRQGAGAVAPLVAQNTVGVQHGGIPRGGGQQGAIGGLGFRHAAGLVQGEGGGQVHVRGFAASTAGKESGTRG